MTGPAPRRRRRLVLPLGVFVLVGAFHFVWLGLFPENGAVQSRWASVGPSPTWFQQYVESQSYWLGYSYALSLAFAAVAIRRYVERRSCAARIVAIGGVTLPGILSVTSCFLLGCCGSPMLGVYLSVFGAAFLPLMKPIVAGLTTISIAIAWYWMLRPRLAKADRPACCSTACGCDPSPQGKF